MPVVGLQLREYPVAHGVDSVARPHSLGAVKVELVEVARVVDLGKAGRKLVGKPTAKGMYIRNGKKIIIK